MPLFRRKNNTNAQTGRRSSVAKAGEQPQQRVISYYTASRRQLDNFERTSPQQVDSLAFRRFEQLRSAWFTILVLVVALIILVYMAMLATQPHITVRGTEYRKAAELEKLIDSTFTHDIRNRLKPLLQQASLESEISALVPEASVVSVSSTLLGHRPEVTLVTDAPMAIFSQPGSTDYIISNRGRLLLPASQVTGFDVTKLPIIQNQTGINGKAGEQFMRPDEAQSFERLYAQYTAESSKPLFTLSVTPHELLAKESGRGTYAAKYLLNESIVTQFGSLRATEKKLSELAQQPSDYIDVRLADKVYYK